MLTKEIKDNICLYEAQHDTQGRLQRKLPIEVVLLNHRATYQTQVNVGSTYLTANKQADRNGDEEQTNW